MRRTGNVLIGGVAMREDDRVVAVVRRANGRIAVWRGRAPTETTLRRVPVLGSLIAGFDQVRFGVLPYSWAQRWAEADAFGGPRPPPNMPEPRANVLTAFNPGFLLVVGLAQIAVDLGAGFVSAPLIVGGSVFEIATGTLLFAAQLLLLRWRELPSARAAVLFQVIWAREGSGPVTADSLAALPRVHPTSVAPLALVLVALSAGAVSWLSLDADAWFVSHLVVFGVKAALLLPAQALLYDLGRAVAWAGRRAPALRAASRVPWLPLELVMRRPSEADLELGVRLAEELAKARESNGA